MNKLFKKVVSLVLAVVMTVSMAPAAVWADPVDDVLDTVQGAVDTAEAATAGTTTEAKAEKATKAKTATSDEIKVTVDKTDIEVNLPKISANEALAAGLTEDVEIDEENPVMSTVKDELESIKVLEDEGSTTKVALTEEQIGYAMGLYQQYLDQWEANADVLGVQSPYYLQYNDSKDSLGTLGEMLILAGVSVDQVRSGDYTFDNLLGMILNFLYGDQFGLEYFRSAMEKQRDDAIAAVNKSGAKTDEQKLLALNEWLAQNDSFDMSYIMNADGSNSMRAENPDPYAPITESQYKKIYNQLYSFYEPMITAQFHDPVYEGVKGAFVNQFYQGVYQQILKVGS